MGWIPCSGNSNAKKKSKNKTKKMEALDSMVDQTKPTPGTQTMQVYKLSSYFGFLLRFLGEVIREYLCSYYT